MGTGSSKSVDSALLSSSDRTGHGNYLALSRRLKREDIARHDPVNDADNESSENEQRKKTLKVASRFQKVGLRKAPIVDEQEKRREVLRGNLDLDVHNDPKVIRIFTSSTFTDTYHERNALIKRVYPKLKSFSQRLGYDFQVVDMRWGVREEATDNHMTTELCLREIELCKSLSTGPFFVTFLSHKYGYRPLPRTIEEREFESLMDVMTRDNGKDKQLIKRWYRKDSNVVPPCYILLPLSYNLPDFFTNKTTRDLWYEEKGQIQEALVRAARQVLTKIEAEKYQLSVTAQEITAGLSGREKDGKRCLWFNRVITDIFQQEWSKELARYMEVPDCPKEDRIIKEFMTELKDRRLRPLIPAHQTFTYKIPWTSNGVCPDKNNAHRRYIDKLCVEFEMSVKHLISEAVDKKLEGEEGSALYKEVVQHASWCQSMSRGFGGRKDTLQELKQYIQGSSRSPLVVYGESGCGKSSLLAMVAKQSRTWRTSNTLVLVRFLGITTESSDVASLLRGLIHQIDRVIHPDSTSIQPMKKVKSLSEILKRRLMEAGNTQPIVIVLDDLDQLYSSSDTKDMNWMPRNLPAWVKIIVSTLPGGEQDCYSSLKVLIKGETQFLHMPKLTVPDAGEILEDWLVESKRALTPDQKHVVLGAFRGCQLALFLRLSFLEAVRWKSFDPLETSVLQQTVRESIKALLSRVEQIHGMKLVSRALGYLTLARKGLTENELEDLLSCDDDVLNDIYQYWTPPIRRLPPLTMVRLRADLNHCTVLRSIDGVQVVTWFHTQFEEAARERYCGHEESTRQMHMSLAEYFLGTWAGVPKPFTDGSGEHKEDRYVSPQPLKFDSSYNMRKLLHLPYHLIQAGERDLLKRAALLNLEFLLSKLKACSLSAVVSDFATAREVFPEDEEIKLVQEALRLSQVALLYDDNQLPAQLIGRLPLEKEFILGEPVDLPVKYLMPDKKILIPPGGQLVHSMGGHTKEVTCMDMTSDGSFVATASHDESIRVWDVTKGILHRLVEHVVHFPEHLYICSGDRIIAVNSDLLILGIHLNTGQVLYKIKDIGNTLQENLAVSGRLRDQLVVPVGHVIKVFSAETGAPIKDIANQDMEGKEKFQCFDPISSQGHLVAIATRDSPVLRVADVASGEFIHNRHMLDTLEDEEACIYALAISPDQASIVFASSVENDIYICDMVTLNTLRIIGGRNTDVFQKFSFTVDGRILYFANGSMLTCVNILSGKLKDRLVHPSRVTDIISTDLKTVVSVSSDKAVRIWNLIADTPDMYSDDSSDNTDIPNTGNRVKELTFLSMKADSGPDTRVIVADFVFRDIFPLQNGRYVLVHSEDVNCENLQVYDVIQKRPIRNAKIQSDVSLTACDITVVDNTHVIVSSGSRKAYLVDVNRMCVMRCFEGMLSQYGSDITVRKKANELVAFTRGRRHLKFYNLHQPSTTALMKMDCGHQLSTMLLSPDERLLAVSTEMPGPLLLLDIARREKLHSLTPIDLGCYPILRNAFFTNCGTYILLKSEAVAPGLGGPETYLQVISTKSGKVVHHLIDRRDYKRHLIELTDRTVAVMSACILSDMIVLVGSQDGYIRVWSASSGQLQHRLQGHSEEVTSISVSATRTRFVTHSSNPQDGAFRLWDAKTFRCLASFKPDNEISQIQLSADGHVILAGDTMTREVVTWSLEGCGDVGPTPVAGLVDFKGAELGFTLKLDHAHEMEGGDADIDSDVDDPTEDDFDDVNNDDEDDDVDGDVSIHVDDNGSRTGYDGDSDDSGRLSLL